jgi:hypothetical protein
MDPSRTRRGAKAAALIVLALIFAIGIGAALAKNRDKDKDKTGVTVVTPDNLHSWAYFDDQTDPETRIAPDFVVGPDPAPRGAGSAHLQIGGNPEGHLLSANNFTGTPLADIKTLTYETYLTNTDNAPSLQLGIDFDSTVADTSFQGRLVYVPGAGGNQVDLNEWQEWNPLADAQGDGSGNWFFTRAPGKATCPQSNPCTWSEVLAAFPNIAINSIGGDGTTPGLGFIGFKVGSGEGAVDANVDNLVIFVKHQGKSIYDFEP